MSAHPPSIGDWYSLRAGELFEVVAVDDAAGTVEVQYFDGTVEEFELDDWFAQSQAGEIEEAEAPEDWTGSVDIDRADDGGRAGNYTGIGDDRALNALGGDTLDLFVESCSRRRQQLEPLRQSGIPGRKFLWIQPRLQQHFVPLHCHRHTGERQSAAGACKTIARVAREQRAMNKTDDRYAIMREEAVRVVVQRKPLVGAAVHISVDAIAGPQHETAHRPLAPAQAKLAAAGGLQLIEPAEQARRAHCVGAFRCRLAAHPLAPLPPSLPALPIESSSIPPRIIHQNSTIPGTATTVVSR
jgi:hypothetical protein